MKLRNKKTGEIINLKNTNFVIAARNNNIVCSLEGTTIKYVYNSLSEFVNDWENVPEEPKGYWFINASGGVDFIALEDDTPEGIDGSKQIGNYFETKDEAEKAVEKLKAWKRLKDKGFEINYWVVTDNNEIRLFGCCSSTGIKDELAILFGGEE